MRRVGIQALLLAGSALVLLAGPPAAAAQDRVVREVQSYDTNRDGKDDFGLLLVYTGKGVTCCPNGMVFDLNLNGRVDKGERERICPGEAGKVRIFVRPPKRIGRKKKGMRFVVTCDGKPRWAFEVVDANRDGRIQATEVDFVPIPKSER